jgi:snRNA-activating protein complex subunit 3
MNGPAFVARYTVDDDAAESSSGNTNGQAKRRARARSIGTAPTVHSQAATKIEDLPIKIGKKYLFRHCPSGACEHLLFFSDMRLPHKSLDLMQRSKYPRLRFQSKMRRRLCGICEISSAQVIVFGDKLCKDSPTLFCKNCYDLLHCTTDGTLIYADYVAFPYSHDIV